MRVMAKRVQEVGRIAALHQPHHIFPIHDQPICRVFWFDTTSTGAAAYNVSGAMSAPFGQAMVGPSMKKFLK
jgi:hypothetical protein